MRGAFARSRGWDMAVAGMLAVLATGWTAFVVAAAAERLPRHVPAAATLAIAAVLAVAAASSRRTIPPAVRWTIGWIVLVPAAVVAAHVLTEHPTLGLAVPAVALSGLAWLCTPYTSTCPTRSATVRSSAPLRSPPSSAANSP